MKILKVKEWLFDRASQKTIDEARERLEVKRGLLVDNLISITPFPNTPKGELIYLDFKYNSDT